MYRLLALACSLALFAAATPVMAADCPGHPAALGTSRVITVGPAQLPRVGTMQYRHTLSLRDHEVVLTFDDGPLPPSTTRILDALRAECVQATFFIVGNMAKAHPDLVRRAHAEGHTIATHSQHHRVLGQASAAAVERDFETGVELVAAALGNRKAVAPFYRFPGFGRSAALEQHLASHGVMAWSADFEGDDWKHISADQITARVLARIERKGRGILVLHDI
jgi:peptidoglycan/xylan/chitin deacetylase (PgdA/CDA1 family)